MRILSGVKRRFRWIKPEYWPIREKYRRRYIPPKVVHIVGMPRTGSTLAKRYLGDHEGVTIAPAGVYQESWKLAARVDDGSVVLDKNTVNIKQVKRIYKDFGNIAWFLCIVRDPRDQLISLIETDRHPEIPRDETFWKLWEWRYSSFLRFAKKYGKRGTGVALVRYEDLVQNPLNTKRDFISWLGLPLGNVNVTTYSTVPEIASQSELTEDWKTHQTNRVHSNSIGRWRDASSHYLSLFEIYSEYPRVSKLMSMFGYGDHIAQQSLSINHLMILSGR